MTFIGKWWTYKQKHRVYFIKTDGDKIWYEYHLASGKIRKNMCQPILRVYKAWLLHELVLYNKLVKNFHGSAKGGNV